MPQRTRFTFELKMGTFLIFEGEASNLKRPYFLVFRGPVKVPREENRELTADIPGDVGGFFVYIRRGGYLVEKISIIR